MMSVKQKKEAQMAYGIQCDTDERSKLEHTGREDDTE